MDKNKKKFIILAGVIVAIIVLILADKAFKENQVEENELAQNATEDMNNIKEPELNINEDDASSKEKEEDDASGNEKEQGDSNDETEVNTAEQQTSYEHWLAAGAVTGISMHYMDFELEGIYLASETPLGNHKDSKGVYVLFKSGGESLCLESKPLEEERSTAGTIDLSTENFGFATFDVVDLKASDLEKYDEVRLENLSSLINQLMLVTLYEH